jgi:predicted outer membrane repeat protein
MTIRLLRIELALAVVILVLVLAFIGLLTMPTRAQTGSVTWYVDGNCASCGEGTPDIPFQTINQALAVTSGGDMILVAQGTYTENLFVNVQVTLMGGYSAQGGAWTRDVAQYETKIASGDRTVPGDWNGDWIGSLSVVKDDYAYRMWYSAGSEIEGESIGYADSPDGINWFQPHHSPLLGPGPLGAWDEAGVADPTVLFAETGLQMWYVGSNVFGERAIGHAASPDALTWQTYDGNPVLSPDSADADSFGFPTVIQDGPGDYKMWYSGGGNIWLATSFDGLSWTKHLDTPALAPGSPGAWDDDKVYAPVVVANSDKYEVWYVGEGTGAPGAQIGYAWSSDGLTWTKSPANPVLVGKTGYWEESAVAYPAVIAEGPASYNLWYRGGDNAQLAIGQATSTDGLNWTKYDDNPVLTQGSSTHWGSPVVSFGSESDGAVLDGFTISNGYADYGGGIWAYETSPFIRACRVVGNVAHSRGGGMWLGNGTPLIDNTVVSNNTSSQSGGGIATSYASPTIQNSSITNNTARDYAGGLVAWGASQPMLLTTTIAANTARWGGGLYVGDDVALHVSSGRIEGNSARQAAGMRVTFATLTMTNTLVVDNSATAGGPGGIEFWYASGRLVNVTIADNEASDGLGGITFGMDDPPEQLTILNSILFFNDGGDLICWGGSCDVTYSDISESTAGLGNISADPQFVDRAKGDYHLRGNSPAIDAGTSESAPATDFEGDPRPAGAVDMGADEFTGDLMGMSLSPWH